MQKTFDRAAEDLGNAIHLEHVNVTIPDQRIASLFYGAGLGLTRDPYLMVTDDNMWMNVGRSQFHLPTGKPQVLRGKTGIVIEGREALLKRLATVKPKLADTKFDFAEHNDYVEATCPWGNRIRLHEPDAARFGRITLGIPYVEFDVPAGTAKGIAKFYRQMIDAPAEVVNGDGTTAKVTVGKNQHLLFRETDKPLPDYDEHHVQIYVVELFRPAPAARRARPRQPRGQPVPVSLPRHRRSRQRQAPVHHRARGAKPDPSDVPAPAGQPQSGEDRAQLRQRLRPPLGDGAGALRRSARAMRPRN